MTATVLIVDDDAANRRAFEALLQPLGLRLISAASGSEALGWLEREDVAVILLDVRMPRLDGFATAELIRQRDASAGTPIIFLTAADPTEAQRGKAYAHGAVDYLIKPIDPAALVGKVKFFAEAYARRQNLVQEAEAQRERANAQTLLAAELREQLAAIVTHDLHDPLRAIAGGTQALLERPRNDADRDLLRRVLAAAQQAQRLLDNVLELTRLVHRKPLPLATSRTDIHQVVRDIVTDFFVSHEQGCIEVRQSGDGRGQWDHARLGALVATLVANAIQHSTPSAPVVVETAGTSHEMVLTVRNQGRAISADLMASLFQAPARSRLQGRQEYGGTGLGLFIVHQVVRAHGGSINVRSDDATGTEFVVRLPRQPVAERDARPLVAP